MFLNSYQSGPFFEIFDLKNIKEKEKVIFKTTHPNQNFRTFNKDLKNYILQFDHSTNNNRITFPKDDKVQLYLIQQYIVFQIYINENANFGIQLIISDISKTKRRLIFNHAYNKPQIKPFFLKMTADRFKRQKWINICIDLFSFIAAFKGQTYRSLDYIHITGVFKLRKIYTSKSSLIEAEGNDQMTESKCATFLPKQFCYPTGIQYATQVFSYSDFVDEQQIKKQTQFNFQKTKKNSQEKFHRTRNEFSTPKIQVIGQKHRRQKSIDSKKFLANTNSQDLVKFMARNQQKMKILSKKSVTTQKISKQITNDKSTAANLTFTQQINQQKINIQKNVIKTTTKLPPMIGKINPWRNKLKQDESKQQVEQQIHVIQQKDLKPTKLDRFKNIKIHRKLEDCKINTNNKHIRNTMYSDSEYLQMSQKFSTITDPKFFKPNLTRFSQKNSQQVQINQKKMEEQIQQQLQNHSINSTLRKKTFQNQENIQKQTNLKNQPIISQKMQSKDFVNEHLQRMIEEVQRPYSPPLSSLGDESVLVKKQSGQTKEVQLIYDPVLNCYYDFKTNAYYELKQS